MIIESKEIIDILKHANQDALVLFDIDNTLIWAEQEFGSLEWGTYVADRFHKKGFDPREAFQKSYEIYRKIEEIIAYEPVEEMTLHVLNNLNKEGIKNIALTRRLFSSSDATEKHLLSAGIDFSKNLLHKNDVVLNEEAAYFNGVLYSGFEEEKGCCLIKFLEEISYKPQSIIFVDDTKNHIEEFHETVSAYGISTTCIRYGWADSRSDNFDPVRAEKDMKNFVGQDRFDALFKELL